VKYQRMPPGMWQDEVGTECFLRDFGEAPWIPPPPSLYRPG
jgi:hypothetical protein